MLTPRLFLKLWQNDKPKSNIVDCAREPLNAKRGMQNLRELASGYGMTPHEFISPIVENLLGRHDAPGCHNCILAFGDPDLSRDYLQQTLGSDRATNAEGLLQQIFEALLKAKRCFYLRKYRIPVASSAPHARSQSAHSFSYLDSKKARSEKFSEIVDGLDGFVRDSVHICYVFEVGITKLVLVDSWECSPSVVQDLSDQRENPESTLMRAIDNSFAGGSYRSYFCHAIACLGVDMNLHQGHITTLEMVTKITPLIQFLPDSSSVYDLTSPSSYLYNDEDEVCPPPLLALLERDMSHGLVGTVMRKATDTFEDEFRFDLTGSPDSSTHSGGSQDVPFNILAKLELPAKVESNPLEKHAEFSAECPYLPVDSSDCQNTSSLYQTRDTSLATTGTTPHYHSSENEEEAEYTKELVKPVQSSPPLERHLVGEFPTVQEVKGRDLDEGVDDQQTQAVSKRSDMCRGAVESIGIKENIKTSTALSPQEAFIPIVGAGLKESSNLIANADHTKYSTAIHTSFFCDLVGLPQDPVSLDLASRDEVQSRLPNDPMAVSSHIPAVPEAACTDRHLEDPPTSPVRTSESFSPCSSLGSPFQPNSPVSGSTTHGFLNLTAQEYFDLVKLRCQQLRLY